MKFIHVFCVLVVISEISFVHKIVVKVGDKLRRRTICDDLVQSKKILDEIFDDVFIRKPNLSSFEFVSSPELLKIDKINVSESGFNVYLSEKAELLLEKPNFYNRWSRIPNNQYCIDSLLISDKKNETISFNHGIWRFFIDVPIEVERPTSSIPVVGMLISCFCMALTLVVYGLLPELRSLAGLILMSYVACQLCSFLLLVMMRMKDHDVSVCEYLTYLIYFFFLASFCWLNVMSYDIWWTFRGCIRLRRSERFKFLMYCIYAFGLPLAMTIGLAVLNKVDMTHIPSFITPKIPSKSCFIKEGEKLLYLYVPMLILILCNWIFYILTAFNIWKIDRGSAALNTSMREADSSQAGRSNQRRFTIYLKLSVIMGLNWVLEMLNYTSIGATVWFISDCYNSLIGVFIFVIFVCKRKIFRNLQKRFGINTKSEAYPNQEDHSASVTREPKAFPTVSYIPNREDVAEINY